MPMQTTPEDGVTQSPTHIMSRHMHGLHVLHNSSMLDTLANVCKPLLIGVDWPDPLGTIVQSWPQVITRNITLLSNHNGATLRNYYVKVESLDACAAPSLLLVQENRKIHPTGKFGDLTC